MRHKGETYQFWQEGVHPELIQGEVMMRQKIDYIHQNPVKRGYVDEAEQWRYSSANIMQGSRDCWRYAPNGIEYAFTRERGNETPNLFLHFSLYFDLMKLLKTYRNPAQPSKTTTFRPNKLSKFSRALALSTALATALPPSPKIPPKINPLQTQPPQFPRKISQPNSHRLYRPDGKKRPQRRHPHRRSGRKTRKTAEAGQCY